MIRPARPGLSGAGSVLLTAAGIAYPFLVYLAIDRLPGAVFIGVALLLVFLRVQSLRAMAPPRLLMATVIGAVLTITFLTAVDPDLAVRIYPVMISLLFAAAFGASLVCPPTLVERFARLREPNPAPHAIAYMRTVTIVWLVFLVANAAISAVTVVMDDLVLWTLYNGLLSYLFIGLLFAGELIVRQRVRRRLASSP